MANSRENKREIKALHKRFDKLEALLDSTLIAANLEYASHPVFQQLVQTGISPGTTAGWFSSIIKTGIDPFDQPKEFMAELSHTIRAALNTPVDKVMKKFVLFAGPAGSGKTRLIMKLSQHPDFLADKTIAIASVCPQNDENNPYYTVLDPFCSDLDIPYFKIQNKADVEDLVEKTETFDHVLIDTPSISITNETAFREYWNIRQLLTSVESLEVHYVVHAALNKFYFEHSSSGHHPLKPDYLAITHLDEVSQWGALIPFLKDMNCGARYISVGSAMPHSLKSFDPRWFAKQVLQNTN